jgi:hypothetical protein
VVDRGTEVDVAGADVDGGRLELVGPETDVDGAGSDVGGGRLELVGSGADVVGGGTDVLESDELLGADDESAGAAANAAAAGRHTSIPAATAAASGRPTRHPSCVLTVTPPRTRAHHGVTA